MILSFTPSFLGPGDSSCGPALPLMMSLCFSDCLHMPSTFESFVVELEGPKKPGWGSVSPLANTELAKLQNVKVFDLCPNPVTKLCKIKGHRSHLDIDQQGP